MERLREPTVVVPNGVVTLFFLLYAQITAQGQVVWNETENPLPIDVGQAGEWDGDGLGCPTVFRSGDAFQMVFSNGGSPTHLGVAFSDDLAIWTKEPANPVLTLRPGTWENAGIYCPAVVFDPMEQVFRMWYTGRVGGSGAFGLATSEDGLICRRRLEHPYTIAVYVPENGLKCMCWILRYG